MGIERPATIVAEDNGLLRDTLTTALERSDFRVVAAVGDAEALRAAVDRSHPDLVITDVRMPPGYLDEGLRAAVALRRKHPGLPVVILSQYVEPTHTRELLAGEHGAVAYLLKDRVTDVRALVDVLRDVLAGATVIDPEVVRGLLAAPTDGLARLTERELETLALMAEGRSNAAIAAALVVTDATVAKHIRSILDKLGLPQATEDHRRVRAVLAYLESTRRAATTGDPGAPPS